MKIEEYKRRVDQLIEQAEAVIATRKSHNADGYFSSRASVYVSVNKELYQHFRTASLSFIDKLFGEEHTYYKEFVKSVSDHSPENVAEGRGILKAVKQEIDAGWIFSLKGIVTAEIFTDFLDMANHLLKQDYKDPAAVMIGGVLEENLRQLCIKNGIDHTVISPKDGKELSKTADRMNNDLSAAGIYNKLYHKGVTSWLELRNKAAHGHYNEYNIDQVKAMEIGVTDFITINL